MCIGKPGDPFCKTGGAGWVGSRIPEMNKGYPLLSWQIN